jgi:hypothetical protein
MWELLLAKVRTETHKFAISEDASDLEFASVLKVKDDLLNHSNPPIDEGIFYNLFR